MWTLWTALALAAPPSSALTGPNGTLSWDVQSGAALTLEGKSWKWHVTHDAASNWAPRRTVRTVGTAVTTVDYTSAGATVTLPDGSIVVVEQAGLWDGDTLDVRLGQQWANGNPAATFSAIDTSSGKVYTFDSQLVGREDCAGQPCGHLKVQLTGWMRLVGPTFHYWYGGDGELLGFSGPIGAYGVAVGR